MTAPVFKCIGLSSDGRTNKWRLRLPCGRDCGCSPVVTRVSNYSPGRDYYQPPVAPPWEPSNRHARRKAASKARKKR